MGKLNPSTLLQPIAPDAPSGEDLGYDAAFLQLEEVFKGVPEKQVGTTIVPAQDPEWKEVSGLSVELLGRTKHLRVILIASVALLETEGLSGLGDGLTLLRGVLESQWDTLYPRLDPDDNNDPLERMNLVASLAAPSGTYGDPFRFIERIQRTTLVASRQAGKLSLLDIAIAKGEIPAPPDSKPFALATIDGILSEASPETLATMLGVARKGVEDVQGIETYLDQKVGVGKTPDLKPFRSVLQEIVKVLQGAVDARAGGAAVAGNAAGDAGGAGGGGGGSGGGGVPGEIGSARDVVLALDRICRYYERSEVSSPVPFVIKAAKRLVSKNFVDIARIMTPDAIRTVEEIGREEAT